MVRPATRTADRVNHRGLSDLCRGKGLDALVCRSGVNVTYLSGVATPGTLGRHLDLADTPRETFVVWPVSGEPTIVVSEIASEVARKTSRGAALETYVDYVDSPEVVLAAVIHRLGLSRSAVGFDMAWFGARRWLDLLGLLPDLAPVDVTDELDLVRAIKMPAELEGLRQAAALLDRVLADVFPAVRAGQTEREVHARIIARAIELGADSAHGMLQSSTNPVLYGGESDVRLEEGSIVRTDYVLYLEGSAANLSRPLHIGRPSRQVRDRYLSYLHIYRDAVDLLREGAVGGQVHQAIRGLFTGAGWRPGPPISGHGIGAWFHQQRPFLVEGSEDVLSSGMVIAIEPISEHWHVQDEYLVTDGEPVRVSDGFDLGELPWTA